MVAMSLSQALPNVFPLPVTLSPRLLVSLSLKNPKSEIRNPKSYCLTTFMLDSDPFTLSFNKYTPCGMPVSLAERERLYFPFSSLDCNISCIARPLISKSVRLTSDSFSKENSILKTSVDGFGKTLKFKRRAVLFTAKFDPGFKSIAGL